MATAFILIVLAYFVIVCDVSTAEKLVLALLCGIAALLPIFVENAGLPAAVAQIVPEQVEQQRACVRGPRHGRSVGRCG